MIDQPVDYYRYARSEMLKFVPQGARNILEVGCGEGTFMELLHSERGTDQLYGIEANEAAAQAGRLRGLNITTGVFPEAADRSRRYDCVLFNDVLEHIVDPWRALEDTISLLSSGGVVVASLPNVRHLDTVHEIVVKGDFRYQPAGVLDSTHLRFFTMRSAQRMFEDCGFTVESVTGIKDRRTSRRILPFLAMASVFSRSFSYESRFRQFVIVAEVG